MELRKLRHGLDGLDISFQGCVGVAFLSLLGRAKEVAQENKQPEHVDFKGLPFSVLGTGVSGYRYVVDTGLDGEKWFFAKSSKRDGWNIRVSVSSMSLALHGYIAAKERIWERLEIFGAWVMDHSVSRVDFACDFEAPEFQIKPECVVAHWRMTQSEYTETEADGGFHIVRQARRVNSLTIGKMPGRQIIIYDKRREVIDRRKSYWWKIWNVPKETRVWRIEVRAGKRELKDRWNISTLETLEAMLPEIVGSMLSDIRLHEEEQTDSNVTRQALHPIWESVTEAAREPFAVDIVAPDPEPIILETQEQIRDRYLSLVSGLTASLSVITGVNDLEELGAGIAASIGAHVKANKTKFLDSQRRAQSRLRFAVDTGAWNTPTM